MCWIELVMRGGGREFSVSERREGKGREESCSGLSVHDLRFVTYTHLDVAIHVILHNGESCIAEKVKELHHTFSSLKELVRVDSLRCNRYVRVGLFGPS